MLRRLFNKCLIRPGDVPPSDEAMEVLSVFNPGAIRFENDVILLVRVAERPREQRTDHAGLPRYDPQKGLVVDWIHHSELRWHDQRVAEIKSTGLIRLAFVSHLRLARLHEGREVVSIGEPIFGPEVEDEEYGVEDPRMTVLDGQYYFTYVAVSRHGAATALASTQDFQTFKRYGIIFPPENKDVLLFPEKIGGDYVALHRPNPSTHFNPPEMWIARSRDLIRWGDHRHLLTGSSGWENSRVGGSCPPIRVPGGWLEIYHGNQKDPNEPGVGVYSAGAILLDYEQPERVLSLSPEPIMVPEASFEQEGFVPNVIFPTGIIELEDTVLIYYGAADTSTAVVEFSRRDLLATVGQ